MRGIKKILFPIIIILLCLPVIQPLLQPGFFEMHDDTQVSRVYAMANSLRDGMFPVRWVADFGYGYGYPIFNFYAPLPYYIGGFIALLTNDPLMSTKAVFIIALLGSGISMYYFSRKFFTEHASLLAAIVYVYFPYHAVNTYVRGNLSELYAYVFLPLFFAALYTFYYAKKATLHASFPTILLLGLSSAGIMLSHNLSAYMTMLLSVPILICMIFRSNHKWHIATNIILGLLLGGMLSAFYILPVLFESGLTNVTSQIGGGSDFRDHYVCLQQFWQTAWGYTGSVPGCIDGMSFTLGKTTILLIPFIFALYLYGFMKKKVTKQFLFITTSTALILTVFLMLPLSRYVWEVIPGMEYLQFPWRFLEFFAFFYAILLAFAIDLSKSLFSDRIGRGVSLILIGVTIMLYSPLFVPQQLFMRDSAFYTSREYIATTVTRRSDEYLPKSFAKPSLDEQTPSQIYDASPNAEIKIINHTVGRTDITLRATTSGQLHVNISYFPAWHVLIDGVDMPITIEERGFSVPYTSGEHSVTTVFRQTPIQLIGNGITFLGIFSVFIAIIGKDFYVRKKTS